MEQIPITHGEKKVIERLRKLPPQQIDEIIQFMDFIASRRRGETAVGRSQTHDLRRTILDLRGRGRGEQLVKKLLQSRQDDLRYDEGR